MNRNNLHNVTAIGIKLGIIYSMMFVYFPIKAQQQQLPNYVIVLMDDMGYQDLACFGGNVPTPHIDQLAAEGIKFTNFYAGANVCSPSRASLLTGLYPNHNGITRVLFPHDIVSLSHQYQTIPQCLAIKGYTSALVGKWHLGDTPEYLPLQYGFSFYYGLPYSNDMLPNGKTTPDLPVYRNEKVVDKNPDQAQLTTNYTQQSIEFIREQQGKPFFLYLAHSMPHVPLAVSDKFKDKSGKGLYGDVMMELDWSVGQIVKTLKEQNEYEHTVIIVTSDNGPWLIWGNWAGNSASLREGKFTSFDGGQRVPFLIKGLGHQPDIDVPANMVDIYPTLAELAGIKPTAKHDGKSLLPLIRAKNKKSFNNRVIPFYTQGLLQAIRKGDWKYHGKHDYQTVDHVGNNGMVGKYKRANITESLFNLVENPGEDTPKDTVNTPFIEMKTLFDQWLNAPDQLPPSPSRPKAPVKEK